MTIVRDVYRVTSQSKLFTGRSPNIGVLRRQFPLARGPLDPITTTKLEPPGRPQRPAALNRIYSLSLTSKQVTSSNILAF